MTDLPFEQRVIDAARRGEPVRCADPDSQIRAELIRELLLGRWDHLDPRGIRISGAHLVGPLDLDWVQAVTGLSLIACALEQVTARYARLPYLDLSKSQLTCLYADNVHTDHGLILAGVKVRGAIHVVGAQIGGHADFDDAEIINDTGSAVHADGLRTGGSLLLRRATVRGSGDGGAIQLVNAHIGDQANLKNAQLTNDGGPALDADGFYADSNLLLEGAKLHGSDERGTIRMVGAQIGGRADFDDVEIVNDAGSAVHADRLHTDGSLYLNRATIHGSGQRGAIRMVNAHIRGQANFMDAELINESGPAVHADGFCADSDLSLERAKVRGSGERGAVRMIGAHIGDQADFENAEVMNDTGPAVHADRLHTGGVMFLRGATLHGSGENGAIRLVGAHLGSQLVANHLAVSNPSGPLMMLSEARVDGAVFLPRSVICADPERIPCPQMDRRLAMDRFTFTNLRDVGWREWLHLIRHHTATYMPFPYQQLAATERAAGHDSNARNILIAQQDDLRCRAPERLGGRVARARHWAWGWLGRYGYRASRLLMALAMTLVLAGAIGWVAGQVETRPGHHAAERVLTGVPCSTVELIGLGIDRGLPLGVTGLRAKCDLDTGTRRGQVFTVVIWFIQAAVWALATLAVASYTGLIRKPT